MSQLTLHLAGFIFILRVFNQTCTMVDMSEAHSRIKRRLHISARVTSTPPSLRLSNMQQEGDMAWRECGYTANKTFISIVHMVQFTFMNA
jgi:hypothetical protein